MTTFRNWVSKAFNTSVVDQKRHVWIDYLRGIVIILVVYHHVFLGMAKNGIPVPESIVDANMAAYSFRMPLFFIFSGIFTGLALASKSVKTIVWKKFNLLLYPYIAWSVIQITLQLIFSDYIKSSGTVKEFLYILYQPKALAHFWYLPALFNATVVFILIKSKFNIKPHYHLLLGIAFFLFAPFVNSISMLSNWMRFYIFLVTGDLLSHFILKTETQERLKKPVYFLSLIPIFIAAQYYYFNVIGVRSLENSSSDFNINYLTYSSKELSFLIVSLIGCATFILLSFLIEKWNRWPWLRIVGYHSLYIYILHVIVVASTRIALVRFLGIHNYLILLPTAIFLGVTVPIVFYNFIGKKYLWFLFSTKRPVKQKYTRVKESNIRTPELRIPPLQSTINNI